MKIAIMNCMKTDKGCASTGCFRALNERTKSFAQYEEPPVLLGFFHCGGCGIDRNTDEDFQKKVQRLKKEGVERIHIGNCAKGCDNAPSMRQVLEENGFNVEFGTH